MVPNASPRGGHASAGVSFPSIFLQPRLSLSKGGLGGGEERRGWMGWVWGWEEGWVQGGEGSEEEDGRR